MLDWKQKKAKRSCTDWLGREPEQGKDVQQVSIMKDENGYVMISSEAMLKKWKEYFEKLINEENDGVSKTEEIEIVNNGVNCASREEVKNALRRMKQGKAVGLDELPVEIWKCMGEMGIEFLTRLLNKLHRSTKFQKNFLSFMEIVVSYRFLGAESENDNKNLRLALVFKIFLILVFYECIH